MKLGTKMKMIFTRFLAHKKKRRFLAHKTNKRVFFTQNLEAMRTPSAYKLLYAGIKLKKKDNEPPWQLLHQRGLEGKETLKECNHKRLGFGTECFKLNLNCLTDFELLCNDGSFEKTAKNVKMTAHKAMHVLRSIHRTLF